MRGRTIYVSLPESVAAQLREMARRELREPRDQAAYLIIAGLRAAGIEPEPVEQRRQPRDVAQ